MVKLILSSNHQTSLSSPAVVVAVAGLLLSVAAVAALLTVATVALSVATVASTVVSTVSLIAVAAIATVVDVALVTVATVSAIAAVVAISLVAVGVLAVDTMVAVAVACASGTVSVSVASVGLVLVAVSVLTSVALVVGDATVATVGGNRLLLGLLGGVGTDELAEAEASLLDGLVANKLLEALLLGVVRDSLGRDALVTALDFIVLDGPLVVISTSLAGEELVVPALGIDGIVRLAPP